MMIKKRWQSVGAITVLFLMIAALIIPTFASLEQKQQIMRFEKNSPVYSKTVVPGTNLESIGLPKTLRATVDTQDVVGNFAGGVHIVPLMTTLERWWTCL